MSGLIIETTDSVLPPREVTTADLAEKAELWSRKQEPTGKDRVQRAFEKSEKNTRVNSRRYVEGGTFASDLMWPVAERLLTPETAELVVVSAFGDARNELFASSDIAYTVAGKAWYKGQVSYSRGCTGFLAAMNDLLRLEPGQEAVIVAGETPSRFIDMRIDGENYVHHDIRAMIFGDAAAGARVRRVESGGLLSYHEISVPSDDGEYFTFGPSLNPTHMPGTNFFSINSTAIAEAAVKYIPIAIGEALEKAKKTIDQMDVIPIHQSGYNLMFSSLETVISHEDFERKVPVVVDKYGNPLGASFGLVLDKTMKGLVRNPEGGIITLRPNKYALLVNVGPSDGEMKVNAAVYQAPR